MLRTIILVTRGILIDPRSRRWAMFCTISASMVMLFAGVTFLASSIETPWTFVIYWGACCWLTLAALLLALWDILMLRAAARRQRRALEQQFTDRAGSKGTSPGPSNPENPAKPDGPQK